VLIALERLGDAEKLLADAVTRYPENADLLARLAEVKLLQGHPTETLALVERALRARPESARALYVRARTLETQGELERAREDYDSALALSPRLAPALSRMWRLQRQAGEREKAMSSLERLVEVGEASLEEKVALAELYAELRLKPEQGLKLIGEALKREPDNFQYQDTQKALKKLVPRKKKSSGPLIIRGGRR
jgi:tetratricopeptide (TPR) repeat protein